MILAAGIHPEVPSATYHSDQLTDQPSLSASIAVELVTKSPAHAKAAHPRLNPLYVAKEKKAYDVGTIVHKLLLEGREPLDVIHIVDHDDWRSNAAKEKGEYGRSVGLTPLLDKDFHNVTAMVAAARREIDARTDDPPILSDGHPEVTLTWDEADGVKCKCRPDWLRDDHARIEDLKSTARGGPNAFKRQVIYQLGYDVRAAFYLRGLAAVRERDGLPAIDTDWRWLVLETSEPYAFYVVAPDEDMLAIGNAKVDRALEMWRDCLAADAWPAYSRDVVMASPPAWEYRWLDNSDEFEEAAWAQM